MWHAMRVAAMKRYALFAFDGEGARGGWDDLIGTFETMDDAGIGLTNARKCTCKHFCECRVINRWHIVDLKTGEQVE